MDSKVIGILSGLGVVVLVVVALLLGGCTVVQQRERGVEYFLGKVNGDVIQPGVRWHVPFISEIKRYSIAPKNATIKFSFGSDAAVTKDMQSIGLEANITYKYDEAGIMEIAKKFGDGVIEETFKRNLSPALKTVIGKYSIYDVTSKQDEITREVQTEFSNIMTDLQMPVIIVRVSVSNFDWSAEFDRSIQQTMQSAQEAKKAEQDLKIVEVNSQKQVKEAEAKKQAIELESEAQLIKVQKAAEANLIKVQKEAEIERVLSDAIAYKNGKLAQNLNIEIKLRELEIEKLRVERWDGHYVPTNNYGPIPVQSGSIQGAR